MASVIMYKKFSPAMLNPSPMQTTKDKNGSVGRRLVYMPYGESRRTLIQSPVMEVPFGVSEYTADNAPVKYSLDVSFKGYDTDEKLKKFHSVISELDEYMVNLAVSRSAEWFGVKKNGDPHDESTIREFYRPLVNIGKDPEKYAPRIKMKINPSRDETDINVDAYTSDHKKFDMKDFQPGSCVKIIFEISPVWFIGKTSFGISFKIIQLEVVKKPERLHDFAFQNDSDDEEEFVDESDL